HMGHALNNTLQDILIRWKRMEGANVLWLPGTDHGGIATQNVMEKSLLKEGLTRKKIGREKFLEKIWQWRKETGDTILNQLKKLGCSCDWERTRFTMDEVCSRAVKEAFVTLYKKGMIYRGKYMVNWCPRCQTSLSDIEVEYKEQKGNLWHIHYPIKNCSDDHITVATTRPETMLGDTAVAVNPDDKRYKHLIGKNCILPLMQREIPIIADKYVDSSFGTGAVKITPAHDPNDYEIAKRHNLPFITVIGPEGKMTESAEKYAFMERYECRKKVIQDLTSESLLEKTEDYLHSVGCCYRCHSSIEPQISEQWYLRVKDVIAPCLDVVKSGQVKFVPSHWAGPYLNWIENLHDWCISRQIWWGHRIPVWYCTQKENPDNENLSTCPPIISVETPTQCPNCGNTSLSREEDVLDTWFSSALWPFSTLGWPEKTEELKTYYPTAVLVTGHEIIYLWIARMIMMGLLLNPKDEQKIEEMIPFRNVYIHGIVRDKKGKKMSKSLGNVIDPLEIMKKYNTDALRFVFAKDAIMGRDMQIIDENFQAARNFTNKIWNAARFVLSNFENSSDDIKSAVKKHLNQKDILNKKTDLMDQWILYKYDILVHQINKAFKEYKISEGSRELYAFIWNTYCDWYLEMVKPRLYTGTEEDKIIALTILITILERTLRLLHPIMPFITEEIWQMLPQEKGESIMITEWPEENEFDIDPQIGKHMGFIETIINYTRNIRGELRIPITAKINPNLDITNIFPEYESSLQILDKTMSIIQNLTKAEKITIGPTPKVQGLIVGLTNSGVEISIPTEGIIDLQKEKERLEKEQTKIDKELERLTQKLSNENFIKKAPEKEVEKVKTKIKEIKNKKQSIENNLRRIT
ncbi:valine--tRNA ligase, partial [bacterium]|nr:valine--tRNA ligase [bacterium]